MSKCSNGRSQQSGWYLPSVFIVRGNQCLQDAGAHSTGLGNDELLESTVRQALRNGRAPGLVELAHE